VIPVHEEHRWRNRLQSLLLLAGMGVLCALLGRLLFGPSGAWWTMLAGVLLVAITPRLSPAWVLYLYHARPVAHAELPGVYRLLHELARRADLPVAPRLYYIPSKVINAFALGSPERPCIAITDGLLQSMNMRELAGILAHEISHIRHRDLQVMMLADVISRLASTMALAGQLMLLINLPLLLLFGYGLPWLPLLLLWAAPTLMTLMQLGLSRTREFEADRGAAELTGDPMGLASALAKIEQVQGGWLRRIFFPGQGIPEPSWLRTHPATEERIDRLRELAARTQSAMELPDAITDDFPFMDDLPPRWHWWKGLWY
jgi:Zn-dependent protease with chaperone function